MIIYNTTYHVSTGYKNDFLEWMRSIYIPAVCKQGTLQNARLSEVMNDEEGDKGASYSLQFEVASIDALSSWYTHTGKQLSDILTARFGENVCGFITLLNVLDI